MKKAIINALLAPERWIADSRTPERVWIGLFLVGIVMIGYGLNRTSTLLGTIISILGIIMIAPGLYLLIYSYIDDNFIFRRDQPEEEPAPPRSTSCLRTRPRRSAGVGRIWRKRQERLRRED